MSVPVVRALHRVLVPEPVDDLAAYMDAGGGRGLTIARELDPEALIAQIEASGLRGRGGAGFPTGTKWRTVASYSSTMLPTAVVVNAAEGEPGTYKDRAILLGNPFAVLEGALIAAHAMGASTVTIATKERFADIVDRVRAAIAEVHNAGWDDGIAISVVEGPSEYLFGEETALLEVLDGRAPFPRIAPPWRRGVVEVVADDADVTSDSGLAADVRMATPGSNEGPPPVLVNNVETMANIPAILAEGVEWFRSVGSTECPGTIVCTITGAVRRPLVVEVAMGTPLRDLVAEATNEPADDRTIVGVMTGVSNAVVPAEAFDVPLTYEDFTRIGSGLGSASFILLDDRSDGAALAAGASRFLAVESCGQCEACKKDGLEISNLLDSLCRNEADADDLETIEMRLGRVAEGARCNLAAQHQIVVGSLLDIFADDVRSHIDGRLEPTERTLVAEVLRIDGETATLDPTFADKQPDWTHDAVDSGETPAERLADHRIDHRADQDAEG